MLRNCYVDLENCVVENCVISGQYKVGGLAGYVCRENGNVLNIRNNTLTNVTVKGENLIPDKLYHEILSKSYLTAFRYTESELLEILSIERSTFYDRKKEAIMLLGIALWGYAIPAFRGIFDVEGDEDEIPEFFINAAQSDLCPTKVR